MIRIACLTLFAIFLVCVLPADPAQAQRVFVAATGSDGNPCTFASPCRTFQHAHDTAPAGGEIDVLDPAGYGAVTITKAISIQGHGYSGITVASGGTGITINAAAADKVNLSGLIIDGGGAGSTGIQFNSGKSLAVEGCAVRNLVNNGLNFVNGSTTAEMLSVSNSYFADNGADGVRVATASTGAITGGIDHVTLAGNIGSGLELDGSSGTGALKASVTDSVANNNSGPGFTVSSLEGKSASNLFVTRSAASGNNSGFFAFGPNAFLWAAQSTGTENSVGFSVSNGAIIFSYGDNYFDANIAGNTGMLTSAGKQ
jgi:hypothetical protein